MGAAVEVEPDVEVGMEEEVKVEVGAVFEVGFE